MTKPGHTPEHAVRANRGNMLHNACQLITYPDSLGGGLKELAAVLARFFPGAFRGLHILPFYPSSGDRGFAPLCYDRVDPAFGDWSDVDELGARYDLIVDFMVNHISRRSQWFQDFLARGDDSPYADLFIRLSRIAPDQTALETMLAKVFRRKPSPPYLVVTLPRGETERVWCTFDEEQIDLNVQSARGRELLKSLLLSLAGHRIRMLRLDAFAYVIKRPGTSCFFVEPETSALLHEIAVLLAPHAIEVLPEIHERHEVQLALARQGFWVYDFNLPLLVLQAFYDGSGANLRNWLRLCPRKQITTLDTHDGLPVLDVAGLMSAEDLERTKENLFAQGANVQRRYSLDPEYKNKNLYQLNCTYYSALGEQDDAYLAARAIQFFTPGIPQVYYVGLLAGRNDNELVERTKLGRNINRHNYSQAEIAVEAERPVVQRLLQLMQLRNNCPAFGGDFSIEPSAAHELALRWQGGGADALLQVDLRARRAEISLRDQAGARSWAP